MAALHFTKDNFEQEVLKSDVPVLVDFWATWCGPCQMVLPIIEELADELQGVKIGKVKCRRGDGTGKAVPCYVHSHTDRL